MIEINQKQIGEILSKKLKSMRKINPSLSARALARKIEISPGSLNLIMAGKRRISEKMAYRIIQALNLSDEEVQKILRPFEIQKKLKEKQPAKELENKDLKMLNHWCYFAILSMVKLPNFINSIPYIAKRLRLKEDVVENALAKLLEAGLLQKNEDGSQLTRVDAPLRTPDNFSSDDLKRCQEQNLKLSIESIYKDDFEIRDMTAITLPFNPKRMKEARALIRKFENEFSTIMEHGETTEVYKLNVQLFPLTHND